MYIRKEFAITLVVAIALLSSVIILNLHPTKQTEQSQVAQSERPQKETRQYITKEFVSPDNRKKLSTINRDGQLELWVSKIDGTENKMISKLGEDESVMSVAWSPNGKLIVFVSYNQAGHSPMTTTHVWVVQPDGQGLQKVVLPKPNERFSTYDPEWETNETLIFKAITLANPSEERYRYSYITRKTEKISSPY